MAGIKQISPRDHGGRAVAADYEHRTVWDCDEDADAFLEAVGARASGRDFVNGALTVWWS